MSKVLTAQLMLQATRVGQQLVLTRIMLSEWGASGFADWILLSTVGGFFLIADFGMQSVFQNKTISLIGTRNSKGANDIIRASMAFYLTVGFALLVITFIALYEFDLYARFSPHRPLPKYYNSVLLVLAMSNFSLAPIAVLSAIYSGKGDADRGIFRALTHTLLQTAVMGALIVAGIAASAVALGSLLVTVITMLWQVYDLKIRYPDIEFRPSITRVYENRRLFSIGMIYFINPLIGLLIQSGPLFFISSSGNSHTELVWLSTCRILVGLLRQLAAQFSAGVALELFSRWPGNMPEDGIALFFKTNRLICILCGALGGFILIAANPTIKVWTGGLVVPDPFVVPILLFSVCAPAPALLSMSLLQFKNMPAVSTLVLCFQLIVGYFFSFVLMKQIGIIGVLFAFAFAEAASAIAVLIAFRHVFSIQFKGSAFVNLAFLSLIFTIAGTITKFVGDLIVPIDLFALLLMSLVSWILIFSITIFFVTDTSQRSIFKRRFQERFRALLMR